jgi:hypothetical protein
MMMWSKIIRFLCEQLKKILEGGGGRQECALYLSRSAKQAGLTIVTWNVRRHECDIPLVIIPRVTQIVSKNIQLTCY